MSIHWLMQRVYRSPKTGEVVKRDKPKTMFPGRGAREKQQRPDMWEVLDMVYQTNDPEPVAQSGKNWTPDLVQKEFYPKHAASGAGK